MNRIYIAVHKKCKLPKMKDYIPIQVGAAISTVDLGILTDATGDNISSKNKNYCELSALYWIWKNVKADNIGLVHYRRFFYRKIFASEGDILNSDDISKLLKRYDIILPKKTVMLRRTVESNYREKHNIDDLLICRDIISKKYPDYMKDFEYMLYSHKYYAFNMFVMKFSDFDSYMQWLYDILFEVEKKVNLSGYNDYNKRVFGFLSERLFNVWLLHNKKLRCIEFPVYNPEQSIKKQYIKRVIDDAKGKFLR